MGYILKVHNDVLAELPKLTSLLKTEVVRQLELLIVGGHTFIPPFAIAYGNRGAFTIYANRNRADHIFDNCAILMGYFKGEEYYVDEMRRIENHICQTTGNAQAKYSQLHIFDTKDRSGNVDQSDYTLIDEAWKNKVITDPFSKKSYHQIPSSSKIATTRMMRLERQFFKNLTQINGYIKARDLVGSVRSYPYEISDEGVDVQRFDRTSPQAGNSVVLDDLLNRKKLREQEFRIINWLDLTDEWNGVQRELMGLCAYYLLQTFPNLNISMVDIAVRDKHGETPYYRDFLKAVKAAENIEHGLWPFSTFQSLEFNHDSKVVNLGTFQEPLQLHVDLFKSCREFSDEIGTTDFDAEWKQKIAFDDTYKKNLRGIIHEMYRMGGLATDYANVKVTDFRGMGDRDASGQSVQFNLEEESVTVTVYGDDDTSFKDAAHACCNAMLKGYSSVAILRKDGENGMVKVADNSDYYYEISNLDTPCFYTDVFILVEHLYGGHQLHDHHEKFTHPFLTKLKKPLKINIDKYKYR